MWRDRIKKEADEALKSGDRKRVEVLRFLVSLIDKRGLQLPPDALTEAEEINVLKKKLKNKVSVLVKTFRCNIEMLVSVCQGKFVFISCADENLLCGHRRDEFQCRFVKHNSRR